MAAKRHHYIVLGAGPAGLQLAYFLERQGRDYLVLEREAAVGAFFATFPRHRQLLSINKVHTGRDDPEFNLRHDWNSLISDDPELLMRHHSSDYFPPADALVEYLGRFAAKTGLEVAFGRHVVRITRERGEFVLTTRDGERYLCTCLIDATGIGQPYIPDIEGIELCSGYEAMSIDPQDFVNQSVLIIGKGNSAFETAENLISTASLLHLISPTPVKLAWDTRYVGHLRAVNNSVLDTYHLKSQNAVIDGHIHSIRRAESGKLVVKFASIHADNETEQLEYDHVLRCCGFRMDDSPYDNACRPRMRSCGRLPELRSDFRSVNVPELYFAGALMQSLDYRRAQSAFIHGFRYNVRALSRLLEQRYFGGSLPCDRVDASPEGLADAVLTRMNTVSSLWQQVGFLADLILLPLEPGAPAEWHQDYPYAYLRQHGGDIAGARDYCITMFRLGHPPDDAFDHPRTTNPLEGEASTAIHPVIEYHKRGSSPLEFHVLEDFLGDWSGQEYIDSVSQFLAHASRGATVPPRPMTDIREIVRDANMRLASARGK